MNPEERLRSLGTADLIIGGGLVVAIISTFLPWFGAPVSYAGFSYGGSLSGFHSFWGWVFFVVALALGALWVSRTFDLKWSFLDNVTLADWQVFLAGGIVMLVFGLLFYVSVDHGSISYAGGSYSYGARFGWFLALLSAIAVCVGAYMKRDAPANSAVATSSWTPPPSSPSASSSPPAASTGATPAEAGPSAQEPEAEQPGTSEPEPA